MERITERGYEEIGYGKYKKEVFLHESVENALEKLAKYEDLEEQGFLLRLPCKVGDKVYEPRPDRGFISEYVIEAVKVYDDEIFFCWECIDGIYSNISGFYDEEIGENVFLTREKAEQKLKEVDVRENGKET